MLPAAERASSHAAFGPRALWAAVSPLPEQAVSLTPVTATQGFDDAPSREMIEALAKVQANYYGASPNRGELTYAAIRGMIGTLGDKYTRFLNPKQYQRMQEENSGEFGGVGVVLTLNDANEAEVSQVDAGGPAARAGVRVGDRVVAVDEHPIRPGSHAAERVQDLLHGDPKTTVRLSLLRPKRLTPIPLTMTRTVIVMPTVTSRLLSNGVGYLKLDSFGERSDEEVGYALRRLKARGMRALVLDLRGNPGGFFNAAVDIASRFIDQGPVVYTRDRDNQRVPVPNIPSRRMTPRVPLVVLVDGWSASAAEIVAAAIQDSHSGVLIGQKTYGKALVQTINPNPDGSALVITTHHYYTPSGQDISHKGVKPDVAVELPVKPTPNVDPPLQRAVAVLREMTRRQLSERH